MEEEGHEDEEKEDEEEKHAQSEQVAAAYRQHLHVNWEKQGQKSVMAEFQHNVWSMRSGLLYSMMTRHWTRYHNSTRSIGESHSTLRVREELRAQY